MAAEEVYRQWQAAEPALRTLVLVRPAPVFGEGGRGNANLLLKRVVASRFVLVGNGRNVKSLAYVENVAAFLAFALSFAPGVHVYNYVDKPDLTVRDLVAFVRAGAGKTTQDPVRVPYAAAHLVGTVFDAARHLTNRSYSIIRRRWSARCAGTSRARWI